MSKLMWIAGILLAAAGAALVLMVFVSGASVAQMGIRLEGAAILLVGGFLSLGLGSVINLLDEQRKLLAERSIVASAAAPGAPIPEFGRKAAETAATAGAAGAAAVAVAAPAREEEVSEPTRDTIQQLEQARQKIEQAFEPKSEEAEAAAEPAPEAEAESELAAAEEAPAAEEPVEEEEEAAEGQLYVVEERYIRMRPARILSDGTVEAETEEGWMRFENLEHLDEYLDAMEPAKS